jgi:two-component system response regulator CiaR
MLTARGTIEAKLHGLSLGADDYITKPFHQDELLMRINVILRRAYQHEIVKT